MLTEQHRRSFSFDIQIHRFRAALVCSMIHYKVPDFLSGVAYRKTPPPYHHPKLRHQFS